jgi:hypothetical protein
MRLGPLLAYMRMEPAEVAAAIVKLAERYWITIVWRKAAVGAPADAPFPLTDIDRLVVTRFGRRKFRAARRPG